MAAKLNKTHITLSLIAGIQSNLNHTDETVRNSAQQALIALELKMDETLFTFPSIVWIQDNMNHADDSVCECAQQALIALTPKLKEIHITLSLITEIQSNLQHTNLSVCNNAQKALIILAPELNEALITPPLIVAMQNNLGHVDDSVRNRAQQVLIALEPKLNETHKSSLLTWIEDNLGGTLKPYPFLGALLGIFCLPTDSHAAPIVKKLTALIADSTNDSDRALNIIGRWGMSWMQNLDPSRNIDQCGSLIDSLSLTHLQKAHPNFRANVTLCALQGQWDTRLKAYLEKKSSLMIHPHSGS